MEIDLDANATTPVLPAAQAAALACMGERFGNPSSTHATGLRGRDDVDCLLYGATEHKAVPAALHHWNRLLDLGLVVAPIPVDPQGRHELDWLRRHAGRAGLVCTMAANNESGVIGDLDGIAAALAGSPALWLPGCCAAWAMAGSGAWQAGWRCCLNRVSKPMPCGRPDHRGENHRFFAP